VVADIKKEFKDKGTVNRLYGEWFARKEDLTDDSNEARRDIKDEIIKEERKRRQNRVVKILNFEGRVGQTPQKKRKEGEVVKGYVDGKIVERKWQNGEWVKP
jgi:hypothetical protein